MSDSTTIGEGWCPHGVSYRNTCNKCHTGVNHLASAIGQPDELAQTKAQLLAAQVEIKRLRDGHQAILEFDMRCMYERCPDCDYDTCTKDKRCRDCPVSKAGELAQKALATQPDLSLLEAHDEAVKREGAREALNRVRALAMLSWECTVDLIDVNRMIAALDQPADQKEG